MTLSADAHRQPTAAVPPEADPVAIRACLTPSMTAVFDGEWGAALDAAKESKDLRPVDDLLAKWRHVAYGEMMRPGRYFAVQAKAELIQRTGVNPDGVPIEDVRAMIARRLAQ